MSDVTHQHLLNTPKYLWNTPQMTIRDFNYEVTLLLKLILADLLAELPLWYWHLVDKNGNWQICWQIYLPVLTSSDQEWQFHIATDI